MRRLIAGALLALGVATLTAGASAAPTPGNGRIAYAHVGAAGSRFQIYTTSPTDSHRRPLTNSRRYSSFDPSYSPAGTQIVFERAYKQSDLWTMNANGCSLRRLTWTKQVWEATPSWSPDGTTIVFAVEKPAPLQGIWVVGVDGHGRRQLTHGADTHPSWSPDGSELAFQRYDKSAQSYALYVVPAAGGTATGLTNDPSISDLEPAWSPDGSRILFTSVPVDGFELDLWVMDADGNHRRQVTSTQSRDERDPAWSPDGRRIIYSGQGSSHGASSSQIYVSRANGAGRRVLTHACGDCAIINDDPSWQPLRR